MNTLLPWSSSCIRISTTFTEEAYKFSHEDNISKNELLTIPEVCITAKINKASLNWVNAVRKKVMVARRGFLFSLFFLLRLEPCGAQQLNVMAICARLFTVWSIIQQTIHRSATPRLAGGTTFHYGNLVNFSSFMGNPTRYPLFFVAPAFIALSSKSACLPACPPACLPRSSC